MLQFSYIFHTLVFNVPSPAFNVFSPGGLLSASKFADVDFAEHIIRSLEHKIYLKSLYHGKITNRRLATL